MNPIWKFPSAWIPIASSVVIIAMELWFISSIGTEPQADEGVAAHLFQLWLVSQIILVPLFALKWIPQNPRQALPITLSQIALTLAACFPVFYFSW